MLQLKDSGNPDSWRIWIPVIENMDSRLCFRTCEHCRNLDFYGIGHFRQESLSWRIRESLFFENPDSQKIFENPDYPNPSAEGFRESRFLRDWPQAVINKDSGK